MSTIDRTDGQERRARQCSQAATPTRSGKSFWKESDGSNRSCSFLNCLQAAGSRSEQLRPMPATQCTRHATANPRIIHRSISKWSCSQEPPMSFDLPLGISPIPSMPSEISTPSLFSDQNGHEQFDHSQSSQSSRIVRVNYGSSDRIQRNLIVSKIEEIFGRMIDVLAEGGDALVIPYRRRSQGEEGVLRFPGSTVNESIKFSQFTLGQAVECSILTISRSAARMMRIMELAREALMSGRIISKRYVQGILPWSRT